MDKPLISISAVIGESWQLFLKTWNECFKRSVWLLLAPALMLVAALLSRVRPALGLGLLPFLFILQLVIVLWVNIRATRLILARDGGPELPKDEQRTSWSYFWPFLWIGILSGLAVMGGTILLVLPGIWLGVSLAFSQYFLLEDNVHGTQALAASHALVKGRWWKTFWRFVIPGLVFTLLVLAVSGLVSAVLAFSVGPDKWLTLMGADASGNLDLLGTAVNSLMQGLLQIAFLPLMLAWQIKIFHSLKQSRV